MTTLTSFGVFIVAEPFLIFEGWVNELGQKKIPIINE